jgi:hypothetical protein
MVADNKFRTCSVLNIRQKTESGQGTHCKVPSHTRKSCLLIPLQGWRVPNWVLPSQAI